MPSHSPGIISKEDGFTLLEMMIALMILSITAITITGVIRDSLVRSQEREGRIFATWAASNALQEIILKTEKPQMGSSERIINMAGRNWRVKQTLSNAGGNLIKVECSAKAIGEPKTYEAQLETLVSSK